MAKNKKNFRILPFFIFLAVLTLSVKVNNVFDILKNPQNGKISISQQSAFAEEKKTEETEKLSKVLNFKFNVIVKAPLISATLSTKYIETIYDRNDVLNYEDTLAKRNIRFRL